MVYVDSRNLGYRPFIWRWLNARAASKPEQAEPLRQLFEKYVIPCVEWVTEGADGMELVKKPKQSVPHTALNMVTQLCSLLDATLVDHPKMQDSQVCGCAWRLHAFC